MNLWQMHQGNPDSDVGAKIKILVRKCEKQSSFTMSSPILYTQDTSTASPWLVAEAFFLNVLVDFLIAVTKIPGTILFKERGFILTPGLRIQSGKHSSGDYRSYHILVMKQRDA